MRPSKKEPWEGSFNLPRQVHSGKARLHPARTGLFLLSALLLMAVAYFVMAPDAPNLPIAPEQSESSGRTAY